MKIGFVLNPIAGMGGSVGLKGTDGPETADIARDLGAIPVAAGRAVRALSVSGVREAPASWLTAGGEMGADVLDQCGIAFEEVVGAAASAKATRAAAKRFLSEGVDLIVFAGGDGTARDAPARS